MHVPADCASVKRSNSSERIRQRNSKESEALISRLEAFHFNFDPVHHTFQFITQFERIVEPEMQREMDRRFLSALEVFRKYRADCGGFQNEIDLALHQLELLQTDYKFVTDKTGNFILLRITVVHFLRESTEDCSLNDVLVTKKSGALHSACEALLSEQSKLVGVSEAINAKLCHFSELDALTQKLHAPSLTVLNDGFIPLLTRIDECLNFLESHVSVVSITWDEN